MNVASLELCKELYELSGWDETYFVSELLNGDGYTTTLPRTEMNRYKQNLYIPAYDLGYLLRKLPTGYQLNIDSTVNGKRIYWLETFEGEGAPQQNDTPEDAACKLAIELFKQEVLTP